MSDESRRAAIRRFDETVFEELGHIARPILVPGLWLACHFFLIAIITFAYHKYLLGWGGAGLFWPVNAIAAAVIIRFSNSRKWDIALFLTTYVADLTAKLLADFSVSLAFAFPAFGALDILAAVVLTRWLLPKGLSFTRPRDMAVFALGVFVAAPILGGLCSATYSLLVSGAPEEFGNRVFRWWSSNSLGLMVLLPAALSLRRVPLARVQLGTLGHWLLTAALVTGVTALVFSHGAAGGWSLLMAPPLVYATFRFGIAGAAFSVLAATLIASAYTVAGHGPIHQASAVIPFAVPLLLRLFIILCWLVALPAGALLEQREQYAAELDRRRQEAESVSEGKSRLLANVSHEIRSPLGGIIGVGEMMSGGALGPMNARQSEMTEFIVRNARQLEVLARDLKEMAVAAGGGMKLDNRRFDLRLIVNDVYRSVSVLAADQEVALVLDDAVGTSAHLTADPVRTAQIITNLTTNAVKYGGQYGPVTLRLSRPGSDVLRVEVIDVGPGIPLDKQSHMFEPFNRLGAERSKVEGTGIGLALAKELAERQGGRLGFTSRPGEGTRFWLDMPCREALKVAA